MVKALAKKKRYGEPRSNSTKVTALTMMKSNIPQAEVSRRTDTPIRTLKYWKAGAIAAGTWDLVDLGGNWQREGRQHLLCGPLREDERRNVQGRLEEASEEELQDDRVLCPHAGRSPMSHRPQHQGVAQREQSPRP